MEILEFLKSLRLRKLAPERIEVAEWNTWTLVSSYSCKSSKYISESVAMGIDRNPYVALAKSITEFLERKLSKESDDFVVKLTERSDGFAAFPIYSNHQLSQMKARKNAFAEAVERLTWANWWDDRSIAFSRENVKSFMIDQIQNEFDLKSTSIITVPTNSPFYLKILLAEKNNGGFVTGGAAGTSEQDCEIFSRAYGELLRHLIAIKKMCIRDDSSLSFYERRLLGFGSGDWHELVLERLNQSSYKVLELPEMVVDQAVSHPHSDLISIHRCLFKNQPLFVGGPLERLCI